MNRTEMGKCLKTARLTTVWASRFGALKRCVLREAANAGKQIPLMPQTPRASVGTAIHKLFERASGDPAFEITESSVSREWEQSMREVEQFLSGSEYMEGMIPIVRSVPNIGLMRSRTILRILEGGKLPFHFPSPVSSQSKSVVKSRIKNSKVVGIPDRIEGPLDGATIIDFKTGLSAESLGSSFQDYELQIKVYAALYESAAGFWPKKLELHGLDGSVHDVPFTTEECADLLLEAERLACDVAKSTALIAEDSAAQNQVASPSAMACRFCPFRPSCPAYLSISFNPSPACESDVCGKLRGWKMLGNGELLVELEGRAGNARVRNLPPIAHITKALQSSALGQNIIVFNTIKSEDGTPLYSPTEYTALHSYSEGEI